MTWLRIVILALAFHVVTAMGSVCRVRVHGGLHTHRDYYSQPAWIVQFVDGVISLNLSVNQSDVGL